MKVHIAVVEICTYTIETACGRQVCEKDGMHAWLDGGTRFWGVDLDDVDCQQCLNAMTRGRYFTAIRRGDLH
jgi:hypothetical protein